MSQSLNGAGDSPSKRTNVFRHFRLKSWAIGASCLALLVTIGGAHGVPNSPMASRNNAAAAIESMMDFYDPVTGRWQPEAPWWTTGNALQALLDYMAKTGSRQYMPQVNNTVTIQSAPLAWWPSGGGDFRADSTDDTGWWGLAMVRLYELTRDPKYLTIAKEDEAYMYSYWSNDTCGGGIVWDIPSRSYKNAISNELYFKLAASLHNIIPHDTFYLSRALQGWKWFKASGMINSANLVNDGLSEQGTTCTNNGATTYTYNQGVILGGLVQLYKATGDQSLIKTARSIADAVITSPLLSPKGILTEPCEADDSCDPNGPAFKGIFVRNLDELDDILPGHPYRHYLQQQVHSMYTLDRNSSGFYGLSWAGPFDKSEIARQTSAVSLLVAVL
ncbi:Glycoside hydrolase family 76 protein [Venustampulla echinocandica]|uniref:Glycoside hydrolase family 76 protein n=1 Tax=Venustampulla echinocandica TaxID=2656787 RepID=A0A370TAI9_9HELO|nr:Glycoside hydrolase family 76 protein [Venustampulla echinocandica]RDL30826.1 Glycoside hydrolase family 76 protein [Venustampulla echinocandica]